MDKSGIQANLAINIGCRATLSATNSGTDRFVTCSEDYALVNNWALMPTRLSLLAHLGRDRLFEELLRANSVQDPCIYGFRGRPKRQIGLNPDARKMGPPEAQQTNDKGRYSRRGEPALYLSDSDYGVLRELPDEPLYIQKFEIPTGELRLADLRLFEPDSFINGVMWHAEFAGRDGYPTKVFSQVVGELVGRRFDGMVLPGVHGESNCTYSNIVILRQVKRWHQWLRGDPYMATEQ